ncbi:hypothetical protein L7F22_031720 [Adiantum nelumboides]|nr:hypothetical protein [Adiantum nelumboides]
MQRGMLLLCWSFLHPCFGVPPLLLLLVLLPVFAGSGGPAIPTTLDGPFPPKTVAFDTSLPRGSEDLPHWHSSLVKRVPSIFPEQIALALSTPDSMWVSWVTGDAQIGPKVTPLDPSTVASEVHYGIESGNLTWVSTGSAEVYNQLYPYEGLLNYTSGIIHHVRIQGARANFISPEFGI